MKLNLTCACGALAASLALLFALPARKAPSETDPNAGIAHPENDAARVDVAASGVSAPGLATARSGIGIAAAPTRFHAFEVVLSPKALAVRNARVLATESVPRSAATEYRFHFDDVSIQRRSRGTWIVNATNRKISSLLGWITVAGSPVPAKLKLSEPLLPFTAARTDGIDDVAGTLDPYPIFNLTARFGGNELCSQDTNDGKRYCVQKATESERLVYEQMLANMKYFYNSWHSIASLNAYGTGQPYLDFTAKQSLCPAGETVPCALSPDVLEKTITYWTDMSAHRHLVSLGKLYDYMEGGRTLGIAAGNAPNRLLGEGRTDMAAFTAMLSSVLQSVNTKGDYNYTTLMHELGHSFSYGHTSGFTYGWDGPFDRYIKALVPKGTQITEYAPEIVTQTRVSNGAVIVQTWSENVAARPIKFELVAPAEFQIQSSAAEAGGRLRLTFADHPRSRLYIRSANAESTLSMSEIVLPSAFVAGRATVAKTLESVRPGAWTNFLVGSRFEGQLMPTAADAVDACRFYFGPAYVPADLTSLREASVSGAFGQGSDLAVKYFARGVTTNGMIFDATNGSTQQVASSAQFPSAGLICAKQRVILKSISLPANVATAKTPSQPVALPATTATRTSHGDPVIRSAMRGRMDDDARRGSGDLVGQGNTTDDRAHAR